ncbi:MAG: flavin monoamine oxidase family protein [Leucobacter sp.]
MYDVIIVGAGPAGLAAAHRLRDENLSLVVLEATDSIGGRTLSLPVGGLSSNTGALFIYRGTPAEEFAERFDVRTAPFRPDTFGVHVGGITVVDTDNDRLVAALPISDEAKTDLREFIAAALDEYGSAGRPEDATGLTDQKMGERIAPLHPEVREILSRAIQAGSVADPSVLSAQYALRYFASYLAHEKENRLYALDGMLAIPEGIYAELPEGTVRFGARVASVVPKASDDESAEPGYAVTLAGGETLKAREVVLAVPSPVALALVPGLPREKRDAMEAVLMPGSTTLCVTVDASGLPEIARWSFVATCDVAFDGMINPQPAAAGEQPDTVQFVCFGNSAGYRPDLMNDETAAKAWVSDFLRVAPELEGRVLGAHLQTWEHCFALLTPERAHALETLQQSVGSLHFAGDYTSATAGTHGAYGEGRRAAECALARLSV